MRLDIILRTCDRGNVHKDWRERYCKLEKNELIKGCFRSLVNSILACDDFIEPKLVVLDDHSSDDLIEFLTEHGKKLPEFELVRLDQEGYNYSALKQFEMCRDSEADLVYSIEDDYLHTQEAIQEMVVEYYFFRDRLDRKEVVLYPFDAPEEYNPPKEQCFLVRGNNRHWRTGIYTTNVMLTIPYVFEYNWEMFEKMATEYTGDYLKKEFASNEIVNETNTIANIFRNNNAIRFNPIPSLALHMQFDKQYDPFIDWKELWKLYAQGEK